MMEVIFHGVRGSFPTSSPDTRRYGGSTAAVELHVDGEPPIFLDLGSGLPQIDVSGEKPFQASALVTHLHLDHIQGLMFFAPMFRPQSEIVIWGPAAPDGPAPLPPGTRRRP